jgi:O-antigen ligase
VLLIAASLLIVVAIVETGTRAVLGGVVGGFAGAAVLVRGSGRAKRVAFITAGLAVAYMIGAMIVYSNLIMDQTATRLAEFMQLPLPNATSRFAGHSGTREYVWTLAMEGFQKSGVMGSGIGTSAWASGKATGHFKDVHSNLLGALVEIGPLGLLVFLGLHVALTLRIPRIQDHWLQVPAWMILLSTFAVGLVHTTYTAKYFWLPITFLAIIYEMDARKSAAEDPLGEFAPQV